MANYSDIPPYARVWIYQSDRPITERESRTLRKEFKDLFAAWNKKAKDLPAFVKIYYELFIVFMLDEDLAESREIKIDQSVDLLRKLETDLGLSLFDRLKIAFRDSQNDIQIVDHNIFNELLKLGEVGQDTIVFNNLVANKEDFESGWEIPFRQSLFLEMFGE